jgi:SAM-dependent methyltransferase
MIFLNKLTKLASRKNLDNLILKEIINIKKNKDKINILNIGSGGEISNLIKNINGVNLFNVDIDFQRKPDLVFDICDLELKKHLPFKPDIITIFEVLEHVENPFKAIENINSILENKKVCIGSVPFNFHIHDEPNDYFRFTSFGLKKLFSEFSFVKIINRNGWLESIFVNFIRLYKEKNIFSKSIGIFFTINYFILYPLIIIVQKIATSDKLTTGYFIVAKK